MDYLRRKNAEAGALLHGGGRRAPVGTSASADFLLPYDPIQGGKVHHQVGGWVNPPGFIH